MGSPAKAVSKMDCPVISALLNCEEVDNDRDVMVINPLADSNSSDNVAVVSNMSTIPNPLLVNTMIFWCIRNQELLC